MAAPAWSARHALPQVTGPTYRRQDFILLGGPAPFDDAPAERSDAAACPPRTSRHLLAQRSRRLVDMYGADDAVRQGADRPYCIRQIRHTVATMAEAAVKTGQLSLFLACACLMRTAISAQAPTQRVARCRSTRRPDRLRRTPQPTSC